MRKGERVRVRKDKREEGREGLRARGREEGTNKIAASQIEGR
jgi:hypothetical protein